MWARPRPWTWTSAGLSGGPVPRDDRDAAQVEAARQRWLPVVRLVREAGAVRVRWPGGNPRAPPAGRGPGPPGPVAHPELYVAFDPKAVPVLDESAWGAVDGGALVPVT